MRQLLLGLVLSVVFSANFSHASGNDATLAVPGVACRWNDQDNDIAIPYAAIAVMNADSSNGREVDFYCPVPLFQASYDGTDHGFTSVDLFDAIGVTSSSLSVDVESAPGASANVIMTSAKHSDTAYSICASDYSGAVGSQTLHPQVCSPILSGLTVRVTLPPEAVLLGLRAIHSTKGL